MNKKILIIFMTTFMSLGVVGSTLASGAGSTNSIYSKPTTAKTFYTPADLKVWNDQRQDIGFQYNMYSGTNTTPKSLSSTIGYHKTHHYNAAMQLNSTPTGTSANEEAIIHSTFQSYNEYIFNIKQNYAKGDVYLSYPGQNLSDETVPVSIMDVTHFTIRMRLQNHVTGKWDGEIQYTISTRTHDYTYSSFYYDHT